MNAWTILIVELIDLYLFANKPGTANLGNLDVVELLVFGDAYTGMNTVRA